MELREPRFDRLRRFLIAAVALVAAAAAVAVYLRMSERRAAPYCTRAYAAARSAADTALVDLRRATEAGGRLDAAYNVSCGELRQRGRLH